MIEKNHFFVDYGISDVIIELDPSVLLANNQNEYYNSIYAVAINIIEVRHCSFAM